MCHVSTRLCRELGRGGVVKVSVGESLVEGGARRVSCVHKVMLVAHGWGWGGVTGYDENS